MAQANKICKICNVKGHSKFYCPNKPYKPIPKVSAKRLANPPAPKPKKPINKVGKKAIAWAQTSKEWKKQNPPDRWTGFWYCKIGGAALSDKSDSEALRLNLCHDKSRARHPELANELTNIFPGCQRHNKEQGSRSFDEYIASRPTPFCGDF